MQIALLLIGTALAVSFLIFLIKGKVYESYIENLDDKDYPMKEIYTVGYALSNTKPFRLRGRISEKLISQTKIYFEPQYAQYYASVAWAQCLTFVYIFLAVSFLLSGMLIDKWTLFLTVGIVLSGISAYYFLTKTKSDIDKRRQECIAELPEVVSTLALLINSGMILKEAWTTIANSKDGAIYDIMKTTCSDMENGVSEHDAINRFGQMSDSQDVKKFATALVQSMEKGGADLSDFLAKQSSEIWGLKREIMLQKGEAAASKLLIPTMLIFVGIMIIVLSSALGGAFF